MSLQFRGLACKVCGKEVYEVTILQNSMNIITTFQ